MVNLAGSRCFAKFRKHILTLTKARTRAQSVVKNVIIPNADAGTIADVDACGGMKTILVFREKPGDLSDFYAVEKLSESPACLRSFLEEHLTEVVDRTPPTA